MLLRLPDDKAHFRALRPMVLLTWKEDRPEQSGLRSWHPPGCPKQEERQLGDPERSEAGLAPQNHLEQILDLSP